MTCTWVYGKQTFGILEAIGRKVSPFEERLVTSLSDRLRFPSPLSRIEHLDGLRRSGQHLAEETERFQMEN